MMTYATSGKRFEICSNICLLTFDIILRCACSYENDVQTRGESHPYLQAANKLSNLWTRRALKPWLHFDCIYKLTKDYQEFKKLCDFVHSISDDVIRKRKETLAKCGLEAVLKERYLDFLDILITARDENGEGLSHQEIRDEVDTFLFAGHDTTASSISWTLYSLAENPEHQTLCQKEIDAILDGREDDTIHWADLGELKYLTMCIKESMRFHGTVPFIQRETKSEIAIDGVALPPKSIININLYNVHHNPTVWEDHMEFRPSRFSAENVTKKDTFAFIPFSAGPRNCIGQHFAMHEQKIVLARILRRFRLELDPDFKVEKNISLVMRAQNGIFMNVFSRA